jgi:hypothetical protein
MSTQKTFYKVTNKEIYEEILNIQKMMGRIENRVRLSFWIATTSLTISLLIVGCLISGRL